MLSRIGKFKPIDLKERLIEKADWTAIEVARKAVT